MGGSLNLPTRQTMLAHLLLVKMTSFHRMLNAEFWVRRLDDAERALDGKLARTLGEHGEYIRYDPLNPVPTHTELMLWRPEAEAALHIADKLNRALTTDSKWVNCYPHVVAFSYQIRQRAHEILIKLDQLLLELDIMKAYRKAPPEPEALVRRPSTASGVRERRGKARKYRDDPSGETPEGTTIQ
jgi:hypothetical protein